MLTFCFLGSIEQSQLNCFAKENSISMSPTKINLCKSAQSTKKLKGSSPPVNLNSYNSNILKRNHISLDALNDAIKVHSKDIFIKRSKCFTKSWINNPIVKNKLEKANNDITEKAEQQCVMKMYKAEKFLQNININHTSQSAYSVELKRIAKSQFLKMHVSEILFKDNRCLNSSQKIQNADDIYINSKNCTLSNADNNKQTGKYNSTNVKFRVSAVSSPSAFKLDLSENIKLDKISNNVSNIQNNDYAISKYEYTRESKRNIANCLRSLVDIEENAEDTTQDMPKPISSIIEKETKLDEMKS